MLLGVCNRGTRALLGCRAGGWKQGALWEEGRTLGTFLQTPRSCLRECVNSKFQLSKCGFLFFHKNWKIHLECPFFSVPLCFSERAKSHKKSTGQRVKHVIHQNKINNERVFLSESAGKKNVCCQLACGDSKHSRAGLEFGLAIICHSCDNACWLQVCGWPHCVYLEMNLKSGWTGKAHNPAK